MGVAGIRASMEIRIGVINQVASTQNVDASCCNAAYSLLPAATASRYHAAMLDSTMIRALTCSNAGRRRSSAIFFHFQPRGCRKENHEQVGITQTLGRRCRAPDPTRGCALV